MGINRPEHFALSFNGQYSIGEMWWGAGIWQKPLDLPAGLSYWNFIIDQATSMWASAGYWATTTEVYDLTQYCNTAGQEYKNEYNYGTAYHLNNWGKNQLGAEFWEFLLNYCNDYYAWIWGDVYSGLALMREGNDQYSFLATYGYYKNEETGDEKIAATSSNTFTREQLEAGCFTWYTNMWNENDGGVYDFAVYWACKNPYETGAVITATYEITDYTGGWIRYFSETNQDMQATMMGGTTSNAFGGNFPKKVTYMNSINSPYAGPGWIYQPTHEITGDGWYLAAGGFFTEATDTSADASHTPAGSGGGNGNYDTSSDPVGSADASQFTIDCLNSGLITVFNPTKQQLIDFASFLYSDSITDAIANQLKRLLADPLDYIIGLNMAHFTPTISGSSTINFGGVSTGVAAGTVSPQMQFLDCGEMSVPEQTNSFQDYNMSRVSIYLPYCGIHELDIKEVMGSTIQVKYIIDCLTGSCVADVIIKRTAKHSGESDLNSILYSFTGNCFQTVPLTSRDFKSTISGLLGVAASAGTLGAGVATGNPAMMAAGTSGIINGAMNSTPQVSRVGNYSSNYGYMQAQKPYLILTRPIASIPDQYEEYYGRPLYDLEKLNNCEGFVQIDPGTLWTGLFDFITAEEEEMLKQITSSGGIYIDHTLEYYGYDPED